MKTILGFLMLAGLSLSACGNNACDEANDKIDECKTEGYMKLDTGDCSGLKECSAKCIKDASCADLSSDDPNNKYNICVKACLG